MLLSSLVLQKFRNYKQANFAISPKLTLVTGPNASGKTNLLEAMTMLATGRSFRPGKDSDVITWGSSIGRIKAQLDETTLELVVTNGIVEGQKVPLKKYLLNGVARRMYDFVGNLRVVLFRPEDLELITDSPTLRRSYLDSVLLQADREYRRTIVSYERGLRQRNKLLEAISEGKASRSQLLFWNQLLVKAGGYITDARMRFLEALNEFSLDNVHFFIEYDKSVISPERLEQYSQEEIAACATLVGPHRDDFSVFQKEEKELRNMTKFASRGGQRLAVLWMKLGELEYLTRVFSDRPILLLDDIFSELDTKHKAFVLDIVGKQQAIITSADSDVLVLLHKYQTASDIIKLPLL